MVMIKMCLELSISIGSDFLVKSYRDTMSYSKASNDFGINFNGNKFQINFYGILNGDLF